MVECQHIYLADPKMTMQY